MRFGPGASILLLAAAIAALRCGGGELLPAGSARERLDRAASYLDDGKGEKALEAYRVIAGAYPGTEWEEEARIGTARAYRAMKDYPMAVQSYEGFVRRFPRSAWADDAAFEIGLCYVAQRKKPELDQEANAKVLSRFEDFLGRYPDSELAGRAREEIAAAREHFARKDLENGITYEKLRRFGAARFYFRIVADEYPESETAAEALYRIAETYRRQEKEDEFAAVLAELRGRFPHSAWTARLTEGATGASSEDVDR